MIVEIDGEAVTDHKAVLASVASSHPHVTRWTQLGETKWVEVPGNKVGWQQFVLVPVEGDFLGWLESLRRPNGHL